MAARVVYWSPPGFEFPAGFSEGFDTFMTDLASAVGAPENVMSVARQYVGPDGPALSALSVESPLVNADAFPASDCPLQDASVCLTSEQIVQELDSLVGRGLLAAGLERSDIMLLPPGVRVCFTSAGTECSTTTFCGYHSAALTSAGMTTYVVIPYTVPGCTAGYGPHEESVDGAASIETHELMESATDPEPSSGYMDRHGDEVADECSWLWGPTGLAPRGGEYNQILDGEFYLLQEMWSDLDSTCVQSERSPEVARLSASAGTTHVGETITYSAGLEDNAYPAAAYEWDYTNSTAYYLQQATTGATTSITFEEPGTYTVWSRITDAGAANATAAMSATVYAEPQADFSSTISEASLTVDGSPSTSEAGPITGWSWTFGDGTNAAGETASHVYQKPGIYPVTLSVTDADGGHASVTQMFSVSFIPRGEVLPSKVVRRVSAKLTRRRGQFVLVVTGTGFKPGLTTVVISVRHHLIRYRARTNSYGRFTLRVVSRYRPRLIHPAATS
jgi:chitodextrinase